MHRILRVSNESEAFEPSKYSFSSYSSKFHNFILNFVAQYCKNYKLKTSGIKPKIYLSIYLIY